MSFSRRYGGALAPRLPSFLSMADALGNDARAADARAPDKADAARRGLLDLLEHGGASAETGGQKIEALGAADEVQWVLFAEAWNDVVAAMRRSDVVNDFERDVLTFDRYAGFSKPARARRAGFLFLREF